MNDEVIYDFARALGRGDRRLHRYRRRGVPVIKMIIFALWIRELEDFNNLPDSILRKTRTFHQ